jgi:putative endonuclease
MSDGGTYYVYILASGRYGTLYIGVTNNLQTRLEQHRAGHGSKFVTEYKVHRLVHVETFATPLEAITREKQLKFWRRDWKIQLIEKDNLDWGDLSSLLEAGMGPGFRQDDQILGFNLAAPHIADSIHRPQ